ncbi:UPF0283 membrane protein [Vibrio inusitatus NBRC 102082]|uniref:UPF0283 membrane protein n=1 Tax=Vibrio inusitatus NBRC 102082 TaxID=1219070 RepID=A0A4Y3HTQ3_9VIBR|nr:TIGR01620 family protein [Vibrio inusitatus]GEA50140.1 UPF0283 membrane protein [Vibrio inusitatus NBRC 102082]
MNEYKQKQVFTHLDDEKERDDSAAHYKNDQPDLGAQQTFEQHQFIKAESIATTEDEPIEEKVETLFNRRRVPLRWKLLFATLGGLSVWQLVDSFVGAFQANDFLSLSWTVLLTAGCVIGAGALLRELLKMRRLRHQGDVQMKAQELYDNNDYGNAEKFCDALSKTMTASGVENVGLSKWAQHKSANHSDRDMLDLYQGYVLSPVDQKINKAIAKYSSEAAVMVAVSPLAAADMLLVAWRNISLINRIAKEYGVELGYWSRIQLLRLTLINMAAAGGTELAMDAGMDLLSMDLTAKLSTRAAQGVGVGLLTARLGIKAAQLMRPIAFSDENRLRLRDVRDQVFVSVKQRLQNSEEKEQA